MRRRALLASPVGVLGATMGGPLTAATHSDVDGRLGTDAHSGTCAQPLATLKTGLAGAGAGAAVVVRGGTSAAWRQCPQGGRSKTHRLGLRASPRETVTGLQPTVGAQRTRGPYVTIDGLVGDGQCLADDIIAGHTGGAGFVLRHCEVKPPRQAGVALYGIAQILSADCVRHPGGRGTCASPSAAHGSRGEKIPQGPLQGPESYEVSGEACPAAPHRAPWAMVWIAAGQLWTGPLPAPAAGVSAGEVPGEHAIDTTPPATKPRARLSSSPCPCHGWRHGAMAHLAALTLPEGIEATVERGLLDDNPRALRYRGGTAGALMVPTNCVT